MENIFTTSNQIHSIFWIVIAFILLFMVVVKGIALWKAAQNGQKKWFVVLFLVNTAGILELLYIFVFSKRKNVIKINNKSEKDEKNEIN
jgi:NADH:ubiquinone oxidoreductase subunit 6 (subunit J)